MKYYKWHCGCIYVFEEKKEDLCWTLIMYCEKCSSSCKDVRWVMDKNISGVCFGTIETYLNNCKEISKKEVAIMKLGCNF